MVVSDRALAAHTIVRASSSTRSAWATQAVH